MAEKSLTITFVTETEQALQDALIDAILDTTMNESRSQFLYGEKAYYQVYTYPTTLTLTNTPSDGTITEEGAGYETINEQIAFVNDNESSVSYPVYDVISTEWLGNDLGSVSANGKTITSSQTGVGVLDITYRSFFRRFALSVPTRSASTYSVIVYILGS